MNLNDLYLDAPSIDVTSLCEDSRFLKPGALYFAHAGSRQNGVDFMGDAVTRGARAVVVPINATNVPDVNVPVLRVDDTRHDIARVAASMYPHAPAHILAVTGTSGKTSVVHFTEQILSLQDLNAVSIGTLGVRGAVTQEGSLTTPTAPDLYALFDDLATCHHVTHAAIEASSQALIQRRLDCTKIRAAAFTNLSRDHLDYHANMEDYFAAKLYLFTDLLPDDGVAVVNVDDPYGVRVMDAALARGLRTLTYGRADNADLRLAAQTLQATGQDIVFTFKGATHRFDVDVAGAFQAENILAAVGLAVADGIYIDEAVACLPNLQSPPGRLESISGHPCGAAVYVDYAHKPGALLNVLTSLRAHTKGRLVVVFGCGGDRDVGKRPIMGDIAARLADDVIITDDNPRSEDPAKIRAAVRRGAPNARDIGDRRQAIYTAIAELQAHDVLVIAGKGHEQGQKFADRTEPFDDVSVARAAIQNLSFSSSHPLSKPSIL